MVPEMLELLAAKKKWFNRAVDIYILNKELKYSSLINTNHNTECTQQRNEHSVVIFLHGCVEFQTCQ